MIVVIADSIRRKEFGHGQIYRSKNDVIGKNIIIKNPAFKKRLLCYLDFLSADIQSGRCVTYDTKTLS